jgi:hypothetical protein
MKKTAVEWLVEQLINIDRPNHINNRMLAISKNSIQEKEFNELVEKAKEMEINQHNETWDVAHQAGRFEGKGIAKKDWQTFETHWEETFKSE